MRQSEMARKLGEAANVLCDNNDMIEQLNARLAELNTTIEEWQVLAKEQNEIMNKYSRRLEEVTADYSRWKNYAESFWLIADKEQRSGVLRTLHDIHKYAKVGETP